MTTDKLTVKQEKALQELPTAKTATEAFIKAGYSPASVATNTTKLLKGTKLGEKLDALREEALTDKVLSVTQTAEILSDITRTGDRRKTNPVEAAKELNHLLGRYPPVQHQIAQRVIIEVVHTDRKTRELAQPAVEQLATEISAETPESEQSV